MLSFKELSQKIRKETGWSLVELTIENNIQGINIEKETEDSAIEIHLFLKKWVNSEEELIEYIKKKTKALFN